MSAQAMTMMKPAVVKPKSRSLWQDAWIRLSKNRMAVISMGFVVFVCAIAILAPWITPYSFETQHMDHLLESPNSQFWLGTDSLGRDMFSRIIYGARMSMAVGIFTAMISLGIGTVYGCLSGWVGGRLDAVMMRGIDLLYSIPELILMILIKVVFDALNLFENPELKALVSVLLALSIVSWANLARLVRGQVLQVKEMSYVEASRALGASSFWTITRHVLPNIMGPVIVYLTFQIPANILFESFLSFIGLGLQPPFSSWGVLANEGWRSLRTYPHLIIFPGTALFLTMLAFNFFGDGLRDAFDPKLRGKV